MPFNANANVFMTARLKTGATGLFPSAWACVQLESMVNIQQAIDYGCARRASCVF
jgi:hypothetical protein